jgi:hypothetical protein
MFLFYVNPILIAAAVIPAIVLLRFVYKEDRLDKESPGLLLSLVIFGILSTFAAIVTEQIGEAILGILLPQSSTAYNVLLYFVVVALSEEGFKYLLLKKRTWYSGEFNCQFDGIVYAVFVALGFALWENISYVLMYGLGTAAVRAVTAVPGHACFGVFMGAFYGLAKRYDNFGDEYRSRRCRRFAVLVPVLLHGSHAGLPRIYDIAACMAGRRDGRIDEATVYAFMEAYQSVTPLTMAEVAELPNMLNAALVKLLTLECERAFHGNSKKRGCPAGEDKGTGAARGDYRQAESRGGSGAVRMPVWHDEGARRRDSGADKRKAAAGG